MTSVTLADLEALHDFAASEARVGDALSRALVDLPEILRFLGRYASWNGCFGAGVASLAGKVGRSRQLFLDPAQPVAALADRSVLVASYFFDAARDEFDDRDTAHRDTHRCLAQALVAGVIEHGAKTGGAHAARFRDAVWVNQLLAEPPWLVALRDRVRLGYGGGSRDDRYSVFRAFGYHLGSEVLADREFSLLDAGLRAERGVLVEDLKRSRVRIGEELHVAYQWLAIHSGHGGAVEADHFAWAVRGVDQAFRYVPESEHAGLKSQIFAGFRQFALDHEEFFGSVHDPA